MTVTEASQLITAAVSDAHITSPNSLAKALDALGLLTPLDYPPAKPEPTKDAK